MLRRTIVSLITAFVLLLVVGGGFVVSAVMQLSPVSDETSTSSFTIDEGESVQRIAENLFAAGLIGNRNVFEGYVWLEGVGRKLRAGVYDLSPNLGTPEIVRRFTEGAADEREATIRILEGWTEKQIGEYLVATLGTFTLDEWMTAVNTTDSRTIVPNRTFSALAEKPTTATLEGFLFPDTYRVFRDATPAEVLEKLLENFDDKVTDAFRATIQQQGKSFYDVLIMASILEREVRTDADRRLAADVFWKRLDAGIPLQSDATVNYATGKSTTRASAEDLEVDSPYNTYRYRGLPPGPIGNPSLASLLAAANPDPNPYYYFLTTDDGTTIFSRTFEEHVANKARYLGP